MNSRMNSRFLTGAIIPIFFLLLFSSANIQARDTSPKKKGKTVGSHTLPKGKISLLRLLHDLGSRYDNYFTIEERVVPIDHEELSKAFTERAKIVYADDQQRVPKDQQLLSRIKARWKYAFSTKQVHREGQIKSLDNVFASLKLQLPDLVIVKCRMNPKLFHLVDKKLLSGKSYLLNRKFQQVRHSGEFTKLPGVLEKLSVKKEKIPLKIVHWPFDIVNAPGYIYIKLPSSAPEIDVKASQVLLRDVLSNYMPLKDKYLRVVWIAQTTNDKTPKTSIELRHSDPNQALGSKQEKGIRKENLSVHQQKRWGQPTKKDGK